MKRKGKEKESNMRKGIVQYKQICNHKLLLTSSGDTANVLTSAARITDKRSVGLDEIDSD